MVASEFKSLSSEEKKKYEDLVRNLTNHRTDDMDVLDICNVVYPYPNGVVCQLRVIGGRSQEKVQETNARLRAAGVVHGFSVGKEKEKEGPQRAETCHDHVYVVFDGYEVCYQKGKSGRDVWRTCKWYTVVYVTFVNRNVPLMYIVCRIWLVLFYFMFLQGKLVGQRFKALGPDEKAKYEQLAKKEKERYAREMAEYKKKASAEQEESDGMDEDQSDDSDGSDSD